MGCQGARGGVEQVLVHLVGAQVGNIDQIGPRVAVHAMRMRRRLPLRMRSVAAVVGHGRGLADLAGARVEGHDGDAAVPVAGQQKEPASPVEGHAGVAAAAGLAGADVLQHSVRPDAVGRYEPHALRHARGRGHVMGGKKKLPVRRWLQPRGRCLPRDPARGGELAAVAVEFETGDALAGPRRSDPAQLTRFVIGVASNIRVVTCHLSLPCARSAAPSPLLLARDAGPFPGPRTLQPECRKRLCAASDARSAQGGRVAQTKTAPPKGRRRVFA